MERKVGHEFAMLAINVIVNNPYTIFITPYFHFNLITADPDDNKFVDCAVVANAKFIVTEDRHFESVKNCSFPKLEIIGLDAFLADILE